LEGHSARIAACASQRGQGRNQESEARFQPSAFSSQLLNKHRQHALDFCGLLFEALIVIALDQFQISGQEKLILQLAG